MTKQGYIRPLDVKAGTIDMTHGSGGRASAQLIGELFAKHFTNEWLDEGHDGAILPAITKPVCVSCDAHVVKPLFFPGSDIGRLAVAGTVNDVAVCGAKPLYIAATFILEEGFALAELEKIIISMAETCREAGVAIVTGDTKVVERGSGDGLYISTTGIGEALVDTPTTGRAAKPGDAIIVSGTMGDHGMAILSHREGMTFGSPIESDAAPLAAMIADILKAAPVHVLRDPTRGGLATTLNEIAQQSGVGILLSEGQIPVRPEVEAACEFLGLDPLYVANEGKILTICPQESVDAVLAAMRANPYGKNAQVVGRVVDDGSVSAGFVEMETLMGGRRMVDWLTGEQLPRIC